MVVCLNKLCSCSKAMKSKIHPYIQSLVCMGWERDAWGLTTLGHHLIWNVIQRLDTILTKILVIIQMKPITIHAITWTLIFFNISHTIIYIKNVNKLGMKLKTMECQHKLFKQNTINALLSTVPAKICKKHPHSENC